MNEFIKNNLSELKAIYKEYNYGSKGIAIFRAKEMEWRPIVRKLNRKLSKL